MAVAGEPASDPPIRLLPESGAKYVPNAGFCGCVSLSELGG